MKKYLLLVISFLFVGLLSGCNINQNKTENNINTSTWNQQEQTNNTQQTNNQQEQANNQQEFTWSLLNKDEVTLFIDKNCETSKIPQCQSAAWEQQLGQLLWSWNFNIEYINKKNIWTIKKINLTTPLLAIPESKLSLFWQQANGIKQWSKLLNWVYYLPLFSWIPGEENLCNDGKDNNGDGKIDAQDPTCYKMTVLTSSKCTEQYCNTQVLKNMFMGYAINILDINTDEWKQIYEKLKKNDGIVNLPVFLFNNEKGYMDQIKNLIKDTKQPCKFKKVLQIPQFKYDPNIEACSTDCNASPSCKKLLSCNKTDKPKVELFVMAYCPFGTQAEKGILPAINALWNKIDFSVKFVNYDMHKDEWSIEEDTLQHCIQKVEKNKYIPYLTCFLDKWDSKWCIAKTKLDMNKINACIKETDKKYHITENKNNTASYVSGRFPRYEVDDELNKKYGVQGSPTLVINGIKVQPTSRSPQAYLNAICKAFKNPPAECKKQLSNQSYDPMFGWTQNGKAAPAWSCGSK